MIDPTYAAFRCWYLTRSNQENLRRLRDENLIHAGSANWLRDVVFVISRRFDPTGRDRPLVELAQGELERAVWMPLLLWHLTRDEFLLRDFLVSWLYPRYEDGAYRLRAYEVADYLRSLSGREGVAWSGSWTPATTARVASGANSVGLLDGVPFKLVVPLQ